MGDVVALRVCVPLENKGTGERGAGVVKVVVGEVVGVAQAVAEGVVLGLLL